MGCLVLPELKQDSSSSWIYYLPILIAQPTSKIGYCQIKLRPYDMRLLVWHLFSTVCMQNVNPTSWSILISLLLSHWWLSYFFPWLKRFILNIWQPCWNSGWWKWISLIHVLLMKDGNVNPSRVLLFPENHSNSVMLLQTILEMAGSYLHNLNNSSCTASHYRFCQEGD